MFHLRRLHSLFHIFLSKRCCYHHQSNMLGGQLLSLPRCPNARERESCWVWIFFLLGEQEKFFSHLYLIKLFRATNYNHALLKIITNSCKDYRCERIYCLLVFLICIIDFAGKSFKNNLYYIDFKGKSQSNVL